MVIGLLTLELFLPDALHLKAKRSLLHPLIESLRRDRNVAVAETGYRDAWQRTELSIVTVNTESAHAHRMLTDIAEQVERRPGIRLVDYSVELL